MKLILVPVIALSACVADGPPPAETNQARVLSCDQLIPHYQSNNYNWWWGALGNCKTGPGGLTSDAAIFTCAWDQVPTEDKQECLRRHLSSASRTAEGIAVVAAFNQRPTCDALHVKYMQNNYGWWWNALGTCKIGPPDGKTQAVDIFNCAWALVPPVDQQECLRQELWATPITHHGIDVVKQFNTPPVCPPLEAQYQANNFGLWWNALGTCKTGPGGPTTRDEIFACAWNVLPPSDRRPCLHSLLQNASITTLGVAEVRRFNGIADSVAGHVRVENPGEPERCDLPTDGSVPDEYFDPQMPFSLDTGEEGRLRSDLREVARRAEPIQCTLPLAARAYARAAAAATEAERIEVLEEAQALADLAVTGRRSFAKFRELGPDDSYCAAIETRPAMTGCPLPASPGVDALRKGCRTALQRAYKVANYLRTGQAVTAGGRWFLGDGSRTHFAHLDHQRKHFARADLGWIAVSGEDDLPHRPVNVPSSDWPQFDMHVDVEAPLRFLGADPPATEYSVTPAPVRINARYVIAQSRGAELSVPVTGPYTLAPDRVPSIPPDSDVIIYIHGMDSRAEEADTITRTLFAQRSDSDRNLVVIVVDLPSSGYTDTLDYDVVSPLDAIGIPVGKLWFSATGHTPMLDFLETFVVSFAETLHEQTPFLENVRAVMGGSLGGNLSFRLGRRPNVWWLPKVIAWSPASIWESLPAGADAIKHAPVRATYYNAQDRSPTDPLDLVSPRTDRRKDFFSKVWDHAILDPFVRLSQPETWTSEEFPCRDSAMRAARLDRRETYDPQFLSWRWRLAAEQLIYSHVTTDWTTGEPRFMANDKPMLLACGNDDSVQTNNICPSTKWVAEKMNQTPGRALILERTGHSVDGERPRLWAREITTFLGL